MILVEFSFEKFRSIKTSISVPIHNISVFIGQNGGGKTSTFDALNLFFEPKIMKIEEKDINNKLSEKSKIEIIFKGKFEINEKEQEYFKKFNEEINSTIEIYKRFMIKEEISYYFINCLGSGTDLDDLELLGMGSRPPFEKLCEEFGIEFQKSKSKKLTIAEMKAKLKEKYNELPKNQNVEKKINKNELEDILPNYIFFSSERIEDPKKIFVQILRSTLRENIMDLNIHKEIDKIKKVVIDTCNNKIDEANEMINRYCNDIKKINVLPTYDPLGGLELKEFQIIKKSGDPVNFDSEAMGKRRQIMLGLYEWSNLQITDELEKDFLLAFDEPDLHFDYIQISNLLRIFREFSEKKNIQVIIATHSLKLIDTFPPNQIVHFKLGKGDITERELLPDETYEEISEFLKKISFSIGFKSAFLFFEKSFVITEGETEYGALPVLYQLIHNKTTIEAGISFINGGDNEQAIKFGKYLRENKKEVVVIVDKDSEKKKAFKEANLTKLGFRKNKDLFFVGKDNEGEMEFEGEFSSEQWVRMLDKDFPKENGDAWTKNEIDDCRTSDKFSRKLKELIEEKYNGPVSKPELGYHLATSIPTKDELSPNLIKILKKLDSLRNS